jgi:hypothetical protein
MRGDETKINNIFQQEYAHQTTIFNISHKQSANFMPISFTLILYHYCIPFWACAAGLLLGSVPIQLPSNWDGTKVGGIAKIWLIGSKMDFFLNF